MSRQKQNVQLYFLDMTMLEQRAELGIDTAPVALPTVPQTELRPELYPEIKDVRDSLLLTTQMIAVVARGQIEEFQPVPLLDQTLPEEVKKARVLKIDNTSADVAAEYFGQLTFQGFMTNFEGKKEGQEHKGNLQITTLVGMQGNGKHQVDIAMDPLEGSDGAAHNRSGTISIIASGTRGGILPTPEGIRKPEIHYMEKLMGPPSLEGIISLDKTVEENLQAIVDELGIKASGIEVTLLDRPRNRATIEAIERFGGRVKLKEAGDLVPSLNAMKDKHEDGLIRLGMGVGGWEEGILAAVGAKALGAVAQGRMAEAWKENGEEKCVVYPPLLETDDLAPTLQEHAMIMFTAITDIPEFGMSGIDLDEGYAHAMVIDKDGFHKQGFNFNPQEARDFISSHNGR